jgi:hypothetical protein
VADVTVTPKLVDGVIVRLLIVKPAPDLTLVGAEDVKLVDTPSQESVTASADFLLPRLITNRLAKPAVKATPNAIFIFILLIFKTPLKLLYHQPDASSSSSDTTTLGKSLGKISALIT